MTACGSATKQDKSSNLYKEFYPNGNLKLEVEIINGLQNGTLKEYYENGQLRLSQDWRMGEAIGDYKLFLPNGKLLFYRTTKYDKFEKDSLKISTTIFCDTTRSYKTTDRVVIRDIKQLNKSIIILPKNRKLKFNKDNMIKIIIPNIELFSLHAENATIHKTGRGSYFSIKPISLSQKVYLYLSTNINDTTINFDRIEFAVEN